MSSRRPTALRASAEVGAAEQMLVPNAIALSAMRDIQRGAELVETFTSSIWPRTHR
jgi:hypothetical protein